MENNLKILRAMLLLAESLDCHKYLTIDLRSEIKSLITLENSQLNKLRKK